MMTMAILLAEALAQPPPLILHFTNHYRSFESSACSARITGNGNVSEIRPVNVLSVTCQLSDGYDKFSSSKPYVQHYNLQPRTRVLRNKHERERDANAS